MKLTKISNSASHSKLFPKPFSIRLPILAVAKISALYEMYPEQSKTDIISYLIVNALDEVLEQLPSGQNKLFEQTQRDSFDDSELNDYIARETNSHSSSVRCIDKGNSLKDQFFRLTKTHLKQLEEETKTIEQRWDRLSEQPQ